MKEFDIRTNKSFKWAKLHLFIEESVVHECHSKRNKDYKIFDKKEAKLAIKGT